MAEISKAYIEKKRAEYQHQAAMVQGALLALDEMERELFPPGALAMDQLKQALGAIEIDEPQPV